jgi:hypothetical protein
LAVFAEFERDILRDRVKAGIDQARKDGKPHGRPMTAGKLVPEMKQLRKDGISKRAIAKQLGVSRTSVIRLLRSRKAISAQPLEYAPHCILQSIFRPAARRQNREGRRTADRRDGGLKMDWTKPLHNAPSYGR